MKSPIRHLVRLVGLGVALSASVAFADDEQTTTTTTTTTMGTVSEVSPDTLVVNPATGAPAAYSYSKTTTYVDEAGRPVSIETVKSGAPVTVHYDKEGSKLVATKVVVRKTTRIDD
jgi:hypothetical protein